MCVKKFRNKNWDSANLRFDSSILLDDYCVCASDRRRPSSQFRRAGLLYVVEAKAPVPDVAGRLDVVRVEDQSERLDGAWKPNEIEWQSLVIEVEPCSAKCSTFAEEILTDNGRAVQVLSFRVEGASAEPISAYQRRRRHPARIYGARYRQPIGQARYSRHRRDLRSLRVPGQRERVATRTHGRYAGGHHHLSCYKRINRANDTGRIEPSKCSD